MKKTLLALGMSAFASFHANAAMELTDCVIREPLPNQNMTAAYFTLNYDIDEEVKSLRLPSPEGIYGASIDDLVNHVEMHDMTMKDGVMTMKAFPKFMMTKSGEYKFQMGGKHLMLKNLKKKPKVGETYPITLWITYQGDITCNAVVKTAAEIKGAM